MNFQSFQKSARGCAIAGYSPKEKETVLLLQLAGYSLMHTPEDAGLSAQLVASATIREGLGGGVHVLSSPLTVAPVTKIEAMQNQSSRIIRTTSTTAALGCWPA
jgi:hypothetical protein